MDFALACLCRLSGRSLGAQHCGQLQHQYFDQRADRRNHIPTLATTTIRDEGIHCRSARAAVLYDASALHAEHDGERLHHASDADWIFLHVRMAAQWKVASTVYRLDGSRIEF